MTENLWDVIIAGGGPAGLSAALMLGRSRRRVLVVDAGNPRNRFATHMHGVLGQEGVPPDELLKRGRAEAAGYGVEFVSGTITQVERKRGGLRVITDSDVWVARALVVATGVSDSLPDIPGLVERWGTSVLHCPYCHGWEVRDRRLGVLTTSPLGPHQVELVRQWSDRVTLFSAGLGEITPETRQRLRARGITLEPAPVVEILGEGTNIAAVRLEDGREVAIDTLFTVSAPTPHDDFLEALELARSETPFGAFLTIDPTGRTSDNRIWAIGNVVSPAANVSVSIGNGALTGGAVNTALTAWDFDTAVHDSTTQQEIAPADFWEERYTGSARVWSGRVNTVLADIASTLNPGRALDLGCGEGADVIWLAQHGWEATGIDISPTAIQRAAAAAEAKGLTPPHARFLSADLSTLPADTYDLVSASFLHSPVDLPREDILRQAAEQIAPGGHLLITSHAAFPPRADTHHEHHFLSPSEEVAQLALDPDAWETILSETRSRRTVAPDGTPATLDDVVVLIRRRP
ncbi:FAD-dependent oxidoreductase [Lysinibacter sp. HNR]|uniref:FAD-dependent oxidoreductase n=1 Tax=Lysinibacter sp. HNR TaxID=3031408 RepID=UPI002434BB00|nr:FAD-dependent oxidoreductase [Lysinibacter sp. HNR]WGD38168.1 FAD-dependent oxidoreductase [Lysinibacter sp. HNR]